MKWLWVLIALAFVLIGYAPQLTPTPIRASVVRVGAAPRHWQKVIALPRLLVRVEVVRL
jgi:hypothetical protein